MTCRASCRSYLGEEVDRGADDDVVHRAAERPPRVRHDHADARARLDEHTRGSYIVAVTGGTPDARHVISSSPPHLDEHARVHRGEPDAHAHLLLLTRAPHPDVAVVAAAAAAARLAATAEVAARAAAAVERAGRFERRRRRRR